MRERGEAEFGVAEQVDPQLLDLLRDATEYAAAIGEAALAGTSLSLASSGLLLAISEQPGLTIADLARRIPKTQQTIGQVVARLCRLELVERRLGPGRGIALYLTETGEDLALLAREREQMIELRLRDILGPRRHQQLVRNLSVARTALRDSRLSSKDPSMPVVADRTQGARANVPTD